MRPTVTLIPLCLLALAASPAPAKETPPELEARVGALARPFVESGQVQGMTIGVIRDGKRHVFAYGHLDEAKEAAPDEETVYEIGSVTKVFTGILLAELVRDGTLTLDQTVQSLFPAEVKVPRKGEKEITLRHLATHTSGLPRMPPDFRPEDPKDPYAHYDAVRLRESVAASSLVTEPGARYAYSNLGMGLLGHALETVAKKPYETLVRERVLAPLGMKDTGIALSEALETRFAPGHLRDGTSAGPWDIGAFAGAGALRSTTDDMLTFLEACLEGGEKGFGRSLATALELHAAPKGQAARMGLGWHFGEVEGGRWHNGETGGYHAHAALLLEQGIGYVILANTATNQVDRLAGLLGGMLLGRDVKPPAFDVPVEIDPKTLDEYVGTYALAPTFHLVVTREGDRLMVQATGQDRFPVFPLGNDRFFYRIVEAKLQFERDEAGRVHRVILNQTGRALPAERVE